VLLTVDIGNTNIVIGVFRGRELITHWRVMTVKERTHDEYGMILLNLFSNAAISGDEFTGAVVACVVPSLKDTLTRAISEYAGIDPVIVVGPGIKTGMPILTDNPREVGADRIVNAVGAYSKHRRELIVVDFGTAITFDYVTAKGEYAGGVIAPGVSISSDALFERTASLPRVEFSRPATVVGKNTIESIRSGLFYGFVGLVDGIVERIKKERACRPLVIATGGYASRIIDETKTIDELDEFLVLKGLQRIYEVNT